MRPLTLWTLPSRLRVLAIALAAGCLFIALLTLALRPWPAAGVVLMDWESEFFPYPFTIQNLMHLLFFIGLGEIYVRWRVAVWERAFVRVGFLPEDDETVLQSHDLGPIRRQVAREFDAEHGFLPALIDLCILQFMSSRSVDQTVSVLNSSLELIAHRVDLRYALLRYLAWVIPTVGFIGTVVGISLTLAQVDPVKPDLKQLTVSLAVAFNTTLVALLLSAILMLLIHLVQAAEEKSVNLAGHYTLRNLINRLYAGG